MHLVIGLAVAGVAVVVVMVVTLRRSRSTAAPSYQLQPAVGLCRVRAAAELAAAWRASGLGVAVSRRAIAVCDASGARAIVVVPPARRFGDAVITIRSRQPRLVRALAQIAARELGPLVCAIEGHVQGFDVADRAPDDAPAAPPVHAAVTRVLRPARE